MNTSTDPPLPTKKKGCFFYGCLTLIVLAVLVGTTGFLAVRYGLRRIAAVVEQYTEPAAVPLPTVNMPAAQFVEVQKRFRDFTNAFHSHKPTPPLVLTGDEINALIEGDSEWKAMKGTAYVTIEGDELRAQVSIPMDRLATMPGFTRVKGRYLNGSGAFTVTTKEGALVVKLKSLEVKGQSLPEPMLAGFQGQNMADQFYKNPKSAEAISRFESIEVKDGMITIKAKE